MDVNEGVDHEANEDMDEDVNEGINWNEENGMAPEFVLIDEVWMPTAKLVDTRRGDGLVLEIDDEYSLLYLAPFNGDYHDCK